MRIVRSLTAFVALAVLATNNLPVSNRPLEAVVAAQGAARLPTATLMPSTTITLNADADSNSPAVWELVEGRESLFVFTSFNGWARRQVGASLQTMFSLGPVAFETPPLHGMWMEAIIPDTDGTWYGYYHNELPAEVCGDSLRTLPRIGAARSTDFGATWEDLGTILEAPSDSHDCNTNNRYFVGGVGDFSVVLDDDQRYLYFFFSQYAEQEDVQGVAVGRFPWAFRDRPRGRMAVWRHGTTWMPARANRMRGQGMEYSYPAGVPIYPAQDGWHDGRTVDAFWGPSVHWNTYLEQYVMLLNKASDQNWSQEGIYVAFSASLADPTAWSTPRRLLTGGNWYPQVIGVESGTGTDRQAGEYARFFMSGRSRYLIRFER